MFFCNVLRFYKPAKVINSKTFMIMIAREQSINRLKNMLGIKVIKVITGLRRVGKTTLFKQFQQELKNSGVEERTNL